MTETGYGGAVDCALHCGCHLREDELLVEIVDPASGAAAPTGALGEIVVSTLRRRGAPLLRYRTGDLARLIAAPCPCGSALKRLDGFAGRLGAGAPLASGGELTMPRLDEALFAIDAVSDFAAVVERGEPTTLRLSIAAPPPLARRCDARGRARAARGRLRRRRGAAGGGPASRGRPRRCRVVFAARKAPVGDKGGGRMRTVLLIRHGLVSQDAEERFVGAADAPMSRGGRGADPRALGASAPAHHAGRDLLQRSVAVAADSGAFGQRTRHPDPRSSGAARDRHGRLARSVAPRTRRRSGLPTTRRAGATSPISVPLAARASPTSLSACCRAGATSSKTEGRKSSPSPATLASIESSSVTCSGRRSPICFALRSVRLASMSSSGGRTSRSSPSSMETVCEAGRSSGARTGVFGGGRERRRRRRHGIQRS